MPESRTMVVTAEDGHSFSAYVAAPGGRPRAGLVVVQEIFGVNHHIRAIADGYAAEGFRVVAPGLFDRVRPGIELGYDADGVAQGRALRNEIGWDAPMLDIDAALKLAGLDGRSGVIGYCWGGSLAWLAAARLKPAAAVCYYGGQIAQFRDEAPTCPVLMHFGESDQLIPPADREAIAAAQPSVEMHVYDAGHGFACTERADFHADSARLAKERTLAFLDRHLA
ncbi:MAG TPA: dienelactone hydrolase family protein [Alphaproteobacteria bacterium]|nr:dienelactone hydrolase family protein [Alphaproteobacteria bacterium]